MSKKSSVNSRADTIEKLGVLRTAEYFQERAGRADLEWFRQFLEAGGGDEPPRKGDEMPEGLPDT